MTNSIFFDLETSDLNFVGQILNYSFIHVDENWNIINEISGDIRLSRLQLPSPYAIMANKIDILEHQKNCVETEPVALKKIRNFIESICERDPGISLIGFNSTRFDIPFLRTSMIRNGVYPYFGKNLVYRDLLNLSRKLATYNEEFCQLVGVNKISENFTPSLKLESLCNIFTEFKGKQSHSSREDVIWTIELSKAFLNEFDEDIRHFECYEPTCFTNKYDLFDNVWLKVYPNWSNTHGEDLEDGTTFSKHTQINPMICLVDEGNQSLWIDIDLYKSGKRREAVFWYNKSTSPFFVAGFVPEDERDYNIDQIREELSDINLSNYFPPKNCDIEQYIYSLGYNEQMMLSNAIDGNTKPLKDAGLVRPNSLFTRYLLAYGQTSGETAEILERVFKKYVLYRYGGKLKLSKNDFDTNYVEGVRSDLFHQTYNEYFDAIEEIRRTELSEEDSLLIDSLDVFLRECEIGRKFGDELKTIIRK